MRVADFDYHLPDSAIATAPAEPRDHARLLVHRAAADRSEHALVRDLPRCLVPGDLLVFNDTKVLPHRLLGELPTGGKVDVLVLHRTGERCRGFVKPARKVAAASRVLLENGRLALRPIAALDGGRLEFDLVATDGRDLGAVLEEVGRAPLPPYIKRDGAEDVAADRARYQTVFARKPGAVAAPTAGLHFTAELLDALEAMGVRRTFVTLHVGEGTFAPVRVESVADHVMHEEYYELEETAAAAVADARARGGRIIAVGTTAVRVLESCADGSGGVRPGSGRTRLFLHPGKRFRVVDALFTNFHLPQSTLLMLVAAFVGRERILRLYSEAIAAGYRFYSFGDAMLIL